MLHTENFVILRIALLFSTSTLLLLFMGWPDPRSAITRKHERWRVKVALNLPFKQQSRVALSQHVMLCCGSVMLRVLKMSAQDTLCVYISLLKSGYIYFVINSPHVLLLQMSARWKVTYINLHL